MELNQISIWEGVSGTQTPTSFSYYSNNVNVKMSIRFQTCTPPQLFVNVWKHRPPPPPPIHSDNIIVNICDNIGWKFTVRRFRSHLPPLRIIIPSPSIMSRRLLWTQHKHFVLSCLADVPSPDKVFPWRYDISYDCPLKLMQRSFFLSALFLFMKRESFLFPVIMIERIIYCVSAERNFCRRKKKAYFINFLCCGGSKWKQETSCRQNILSVFFSLVLSSDGSLITQSKPFSPDLNHLCVNFIFFSRFSLKRRTFQEADNPLIWNDNLPLLISFSCSWFEEGRRCLKCLRRKVASKKLAGKWCETLSFIKKIINVINLTLLMKSPQASWVSDEIWREKDSLWGEWKKKISLQTKHLPHLLSFSYHSFHSFAILEAWIREPWRLQNKTIIITLCPLFGLFAW